MSTIRYLRYAFCRKMKVTLGCVAWRGKIQAEGANDIVGTTVTGISKPYLIVSDSLNRGPVLVER